MGLAAKAFDGYRRDAAAPDAARYTFFEQMLGLIQGRADQLEDEAPWDAPEDGRLLELYLGAEPVLARAPVGIDADGFARTCREVARHIAQNAGLEHAAAEALMSYDWDAFARRCDLALAGSSPSEFLQGELARMDEHEVSLDLPAGVFAMVPSLALRAHLQPAAQKVARVHKAHYDKEGERETERPVACPVCGSPASASWVGNTGGSDGRGRMMYCASCGMQWDFDRVRCGSCGSRNENHLHYENVQGDRAHRLQLCDDCGGYHRVVFQDEIAVRPLVMEVEDVVMANLDALALSRQG